MNIKIYTYLGELEMVSFLDFMAKVTVEQIRYPFYRYNTIGPNKNPFSCKMTDIEHDSGIELTITSDGIVDDVRQSFREQIGFFMSGNGTNFTEMIQKYHEDIVCNLNKYPTHMVCLGQRTWALANPDWFKLVWCNNPRSREQQSQKLWGLVSFLGKEQKAIIIEQKVAPFLKNNRFVDFGK